MLLALVLDRTKGHPDNSTATARMLGTDRETYRRHRADLLARGFVEQRDGYLVATDKGRLALQARCDPLPRAMLRGRGDRPSLPVLRACAVVY
ncbi:MAG: hypothetical protein WAT39_15800, partial [Planctomycetota bacterium]